MIKKKNVIRQYDLIEKYQEKTSLPWNDCCDLVGRYDQTGEYDLSDCDYHIEDEEDEDDKVFWLFLKELIIDNKIKSLMITSE